MPKYAIYDAGSGEIMRFFDGDDSIAALQCRDNESACVVSASTSQKQHYIKLSTKKPNQRLMTPCTPSVTTLAADGVATLALSQMQPETKVTISGPAQDTFTGDGSTQLTFTTPGTYTITAQAVFPRLPKVIQIHAY